MRSRSTVLPTGVAGHERRSRSAPQRAVRIAGQRVGLTDVGRRRAVNQDAYLAGERLLAVADGVGGGPAGEVASRLAVEALARDSARVRSAEELRSLALAAAGEVHAAGVANPRLTGMATTLTAALLVPGGLAVVHAGDSRLYRLRRGELELLTRDHALVPQLVASGLLPPERAASHPLRNVLTRALGRDPDTDFDARFVDVEPGDVVLLCTDGLTKMLSDGEIAAIVGGAPSLAAAADDLVRAANAAGGRDNVTVVLAGAPAAAALAA